MSTLQSHTISVLNHLIETLKDGQEGFKAAAEDVKSAELRSLFNRYSLQRSRFSGELQTLAHSLGEHEPEDSGSTAGALHRGWMDLKSAFTGMDDHAILAECERGEDSAVEAYKEALNNEELPANIRQAVMAQYTEVQAAHDRVKDLRDSLA